MPQKNFEAIEKSMRLDGCLKQELMSSITHIDSESDILPLNFDIHEEDQKSTFEKEKEEENDYAEFPKLLTNIKTIGRPKDKCYFKPENKNKRSTVFVKNEKLQKIINEPNYWLDDEIIFSFLKVFKINLQEDVIVIDPLFKENILTEVNGFGISFAYIFIYFKTVTSNET